jgi:hypothetical protein
MSNRTDWFKIQIVAIILALFAIAAIMSVHIGRQAYRGSQTGTEITVEKPSGHSKVDFKYVKGARVAFK